MKDIDFDELDRAVGSVLGADNKTDNPAKTDSPAAAVATADPEPRPSSAASDDDTSPQSGSVAGPIESHESETSPVAPEIKPSVSPARKRGQFLDMVHPSADMRKAPKMPTAARKTLAPLNAAASPETVESNPSAKMPEAPDIEEAAPVTVAPPVVDEVGDVSQETSKKEWPDPLDFAKESSHAPTATQEPLPASVEVESAVESAQTPFVADAKVDKRPLGAFASQEEPETATPASEMPVQPAETKDDAPEFNPEVNSIESAGVPQAEDEATGLTGEVSVSETAADEESVESPEPATPVSEATQGDSDSAQVESEPAEVIPEETVSQEAKASSSEPAVAAPSILVGQSPSIPQQYKTSDAHKEDEDSHPLFDTEEYHQPLLAEGKKKPSKIILIVVLLVVLLALGGALGYIAYNVGI